MNEVTVNTFTSNISRSYCPSKTLSDSILSLRASKLGFVKLHLSEGAIHCHWALKVKALWQGKASSGTNITHTIRYKGLIV